MFEDVALYATPTQYFATYVIIPIEISVMIGTFNSAAIAIMFYVFPPVYTNNFTK